MNSVHVELLEKDLWKKFSSVTNEMIVTKSGRRMFPVVKIRITGLNPTGFYQMKLEFVQIGTSRWKYMSGGWQTGGKAESSPCQSIYMHPDSPNLGSFWMKPEGITFSKVKLTNKPNALDQQVVLNSLHKYQPVLQILQMDGNSSETLQVFKIEFPEAEFIAVTAYQNESVTNLKIRHNPFAKAFQDNRETRLPSDSCYPVHSLSAYNSANLASLTQLNPSLNGLSGLSGNGNHHHLNHLGSSGSNGSLVSLSNANANSSAASVSYLERPAIVKCGSPVGPTMNGGSSSTGHSPNGNHSPTSSHLLSGSTYANGLCNPNSAYPASYLASAMNNYYNSGCSAATTYQELTNYHNLQSPADHQTIMISSSGSPTGPNYSNLISLNSSSTGGSQSPICNLSNSQCLSTTSESLTSGSSTSHHNSSSINSSCSSGNLTGSTSNSSLFTIKSSGSPVAADLSSPNANLSSSSCSSSSSSLSLSSYCERNTPLRSYRAAPYPKAAAAAVGHNSPATYMNSYYSNWSQHPADQHWSILPEYYSSVNLQS